MNDAPETFRLTINHYGEWEVAGDLLPEDCVEYIRADVVERMVAAAIRKGRNND